MNFGYGIEQECSGPNQLQDRKIDSVPVIKHTCGNIDDGIESLVSQNGLLLVDNRVFCERTSNMANKAGSFETKLSEIVFSMRLKDTDRSSDVDEEIGRGIPRARVTNARVRMKHSDALSVLESADINYQFQREIILSNLKLMSISLSLSQRRNLALYQPKGKELQNSTLLTVSS